MYFFWCRPFSEVALFRGFKEGVRLQPLAPGGERGALNWFFDSQRCPRALKETPGLAL